MTDWIDRAQELQERARQISIRSAQRVAAALEEPRPVRTCADCPDPIEPERLAACRGAARCLTCQEAHERFLRTRAR